MRRVFLWADASKSNVCARSPSPGGISSDSLRFVFRSDFFVAFGNQPAFDLLVGFVEPDALERREQLQRQFAAISCRAYSANAFLVARNVLMLSCRVNLSHLVNNAWIGFPVGANHSIMILSSSVSGRRESIIRIMPSSCERICRYVDSNAANAAWRRPALPHNRSPANRPHAPSARPPGRWRNS